MSGAVPISGAQAAEIIRDCGEIKADTAYKKDELTGLWREIDARDYPPKFTYGA